MDITFNYMLLFLQLIKAGKLSSAFGVQQRIAMTFAIWDSSDRPMVMGRIPQTRKIGNVVAPEDRTGGRSCQEEEAVCVGIL